MARISNAAAAASAKRRLVRTMRGVLAPISRLVRTIRGVVAPTSQLVRTIRSWGVGGQATAAPSAYSSSSSSGTGCLLDPRPKLGQRPREPRLDGAHRDAESGRSLLAAQFEEVAAGDDQAILVAECVDHGQEAAPLVRGHGHRLGGCGRHPRAGALDQPELELLAASSRADPVPRLIGDDLEQPGAQPGTFAEAAKRAVGLDEA